MDFMKTLKSEWIKTLATPGIWVGAACSVVPLLITVLQYVQSDADVPVGGNQDPGGLVVTLALQCLVIGVPAPLIVGGVVAGMEMVRPKDTTNTITGMVPTCLATPRRTQVFLAKVLVIIPLCLGMVAIGIGGVVWLNVVLYDQWILGVGAVTATTFGVVVMYWIMLGLLGFSVVVLAKTLAIPLTVLIAHFSLVSVTLLLASTGYWVRFFPELAMAGLIFPEETAQNGLLHMQARGSLATNPSLNMAVLLAWLLVPLGFAWMRFTRLEVQV